MSAVESGVAGKILQLLSSKSDLHELLFGADAIPAAIQQRFRTRLESDSSFVRSVRFVIERQSRHGREP